MKESAGKKKGRGSAGHGNPYLARVPGNAAAAAGKTGTFLGERYRRIARRRGSKRAIVAIGRSILVIIWHLPADPGAQFRDLGPGFYAARTDPERRKRGHVRLAAEPRKTDRNASADRAAILPSRFRGRHDDGGAVLH